VRIAVTANEFYASVARRLRNDGHELVWVNSAAPTIYPHAETLRAVATECGAEFRTGPVTLESLSEAEGLGAEVLLSIAYPRRIPIPASGRLSLVNVHSSPLPEGRGPAPLEWAILQGRDSTAVTLHEMVQKFDAGPILLQRPLPLLATENIASLRYRARSVIEEVASAGLGSFEALWATRQPQGPGSYCHVPRTVDRTIDPARTTAEIDRLLRAFQPGNRYAIEGGRQVVLGQASCWQQAHTHPPGFVAGASGRRRLVAIADGYLYYEALPSARETLVSGLKYRASQLTRKRTRRA
jgi:methionyl-tRNA formyltransferase